MNDNDLRHLEAELLRFRREYCWSDHERPEDMPTRERAISEALSTVRQVATHGPLYRRELAGEQLASAMGNPKRFALWWDRLCATGEHHVRTFTATMSVPWAAMDKMERPDD